jgi:hypothetical protein
VGVQRGHVIAALALFAIVYTSRVVAADPLTPAVQADLIVAVMAGEVGVPDEPRMGLVPRLGEGMGQTGDARRNAPGAGMVVWAFEGEEVKLHAVILRQLRSMTITHPQPAVSRRVVASPHLQQWIQQLALARELGRVSALGW